MAEVSACSKGQQWQMGLELMSGMLARRLAVQGITQSVVIGMCQSPGLLENLETDDVVLNGLFGWTSTT